MSDNSKRNAIRKKLEGEYLTDEMIDKIIHFMEAFRCSAETAYKALRKPWE